MSALSPRAQTLAAALVSAATTGVASAEPAAADKLFKEGAALLEGGKIAEACAKFEASEKESDALATVEALADCEERAGHHPRAYQLFGDVAARASANFDSAKADKANARKTALEPKVGKAILVVPAGAAVDVALDGVSLTSDRLGAELLVAAGDHVVRSTVPGSPPQAIEGTITVPGNLGVVRVTVPTRSGEKFVATDGAAGPIGPIVVKTGGGAPPPPPPVDESPAAGWIVLGALGIAGGTLMTGVAIGLFVAASDETGSEKIEHTAGGIALVILGPLAIAGGIGAVYWGVHPSKMPPVQLNPFASVPDLVIGPRYAGVRWHF